MWQTDLLGVHKSCIPCNIEHSRLSLPRTVRVSRWLGWWKSTRSSAAIECFHRLFVFPSSSCQGQLIALESESMLVNIPTIINSLYLRILTPLDKETSSGNLGESCLIRAKTLFRYYTTFSRCTRFSKCNNQFEPLVSFAI